MTSKKDRALGVVGGAVAALSAAWAFVVSALFTPKAYRTQTAIVALFAVVSLIVAVLGGRSALREIGGPAPRWIWLGGALLLLSIPLYMVATFI